MLQLEAKTRRQVESGIDALEREFDGRIEHETVEAVGGEVLSGLLETARVADFIPVLVRRHTHERLEDMIRPQADRHVGGAPAH